MDPRRPRYRWLEPSLRRIRDPFLEDHPDLSDAVAKLFDTISEDPYEAGLPWKGHGEDIALPNSFTSASEGVVARYQVFRDHPLLGLIALLDLR